MEFSIGEFVERKMDGRVGVVKKAEPYNEDYVFYVHFRDDRTDDVWAGVTGAWRRHFNLHAHTSSKSRDCDGDYSSGGNVYEMTTQERCEEFGDLHFQQRVVGYTVSLHGHGELKVTPEGVEWYETTDEGYRATDVQWCSDECPAERSWQRDHRAEAMGY